MQVKKVLTDKREKILREWYNRILDTYPPETARFLRSGNNEFTNPVGQTIKEGISGILSEILSDDIGEGITTYLDRIIRVRAVQDFTPFEAVGFVFELKKIMREVLREELGDNLPVEELLAVEERVDSIAGMAFNIFMQCREKLYELKATELRNWTYRLLERVNQSFEVQEKD